MISDIYHQSDMPLTIPSVGIYNPLQGEEHTMQDQDTVVEAAPVAETAPAAEAPAEDVNARTILDDVEDALAGYEGAVGGDAFKAKVEGILTNADPTVLRAGLKTLADCKPEEGKPFDPLNAIVAFAGNLAEAIRTPQRPAANQG